MLVNLQAAASGGECREPEQPQKEALWQKKNEAVVEQEFQKDLEVLHVLLQQHCVNVHA